MPQSKKSTYYFIGALSDQSARYFVSNLRLSDGFFLEVVMDGISIWGSTYKNIYQIRPKIENTLDIITAAFSFRAKEPISYTIKNWIEAKGVIAKENMIGWIIPRLKLPEHYPARSPKNTHWKRAASFYNDFYNGKGNGNHILALKDYRSAIMEKGEDSFLFAYRSIEDICRAVTGYDDVDKHWNDMHYILGTSKKLIDPLTKVATKVRHGNTTHKIVRVAKKRRDKLIPIARKVIDKELKRIFPTFIK